MVFRPGGLFLVTLQLGVYRGRMIETYVLGACVVGLGVAFLVFWVRVNTRFDAMDDAARETLGLAEKADRASRRLQASQNSEQDEVRIVG